MNDMRYIVLLLICFSSQSILSQDIDTMYKKVTQAFQESFNAQDVDTVFDLYTPDLQEAMTKEGVTRFIKGCHEQFGNLKNLTFIETAEGVNSYTAEFDKISLIMELQLSEDGKISTIQFQEP